MINIPKIAHFYWGNSCLPFLRYITFYSFSKYNPEWKIKLYKPKIISAINNSNMQKLDNTIDYSNDLLKINNLEIIEIETEIFPYNKLSETHRSDFLRYDILSNEGGFYSDTDIIYFKSLSKLIVNNNNANLFFTEYPGDNKRITPIGTLFSSPNNHFYNKVKNDCLNIINNNIDLEYQDLGSTLFYKNYNIHSEKNIGLFDYKSFYKYLWTDVEKLFSYDVSQNILTDKEAIACHFYGGCEWVHQFIQQINANNYKNYNNTVTKLIEYIMEE